MKRSIAWIAGIVAVLVTAALWWCPFGSCTVDDAEIVHGDVLFALDTLALNDRDTMVAGHLVLLAPDYDSATFVRQIHRFSSLVDRITLYASDNDRPLAVSALLHVQPRLGQAGEHLTVLPGVETIDVSPLGRYHPSGHEYFFYQPVVADDLTESLVHGTRPGARKHIKARLHQGRRYWALTPPGSESYGTADGR